MVRRRAAAIPAGLTSAIIAVLIVWMHGPAPRAAGAAPQIPGDVRVRAERDGRIRVIVELKLPSGAHRPEGHLQDDAAVIAQRQEIGGTRSRVLAKLPPGLHRVIRQYQTVPYVALEVTPAALAVLESAAEVVRVMDDPILRPVLADSVPLIEGDQAWASGYDGAGTTIAMLDTGVDSTHPFLAGKVVEEACYSSIVAGTSQSFCPNGLDHQIGAGAAVPCPASDCLHGTHVAGIASGNGAFAGQPFSGVARGAQLMAVQVFSQITDAASCGGTAPCVGAFSSDIIAGLERVYAVATQRNIVAVNMSLGGNSFSAPCDTEPYKPSIDNLRAIGIATVVAAGNSGIPWEISSPACISSAVSVGSTDKSDAVSWFSNVAPFLSLFAPGESITSSVPGGGYAELSGTSMATPHVAGAWAVLRQAVPGGSVSAILNALQTTGLPITDTRFFGIATATVPRVRIFQALASLVPITNPSPTITTLSPASGRALGGAFLLTINGSNFDGFSVARWNGADRPTKALSTTKLQASIPATDLSNPGAAQVSVFTPAPGGGTSSALTFTIDPPAQLTVSAPLVAPGGSATVTLTNGFGGSTDWLALVPTGAPNTAYLQFTYVGAGVTSRTWTITMPTTAGSYEFRLFLNGGYTRAATSPPVTVDPALNPVPTIASLTPTKAFVGGAAFTLTLAGSNFTAASVVQWNGVSRPTTFGSATQLLAAIGAPEIAAAGTAQVTVFTPTPGGGTSAALPFTISAPPLLTVSATNATGGSSVTVTLTDGGGGATDWLALASTSAANTSYLQYTYVGAGVTTRTWTVTMPTTGGTYEFRLFLNNGYARAATSPTITVPASPPVLTSISPASGGVGTSAFTLSAAGSGFAASSKVRWNGGDRPTTFVSGTLLQAAISAADLATLGTAQVTVFTPAPGGGVSAALPFAITVPPTLTVNATTVSGGASVTVTLANGLGGASDWIALASTAAPNTTYQQFTYVGANVTTRTWTVTMPATAGTYEFRLFLNGGYTRAATSPPVTVDSSSQPVPSIASLTPAKAFAGNPAFTLTITGSNFTASSVVQWNGASRPTTFGSATQVQAAIGAADIAAVGTVQVTVFTPAPGGGTSAPLPFTISATPSLAVSATNVAGGGSVTVTLTNSAGGTTDWLALASTTAPNTSYLQYTYVGAGVTTRTWTVTMPATAGAYEFRLFPNGGYTRTATSPPVTVNPALNPVPTIASLTPAKAFAGNPAFTLTLAGSNFTTSSVVQWNGSSRPTAFNSAIQLQAAIGAADIADVGTAQVTVFTPAPGGGTSAALPFTIGAPPLLMVSAANVAGGGSVTVTLTNGAGGPTDWLALASTAASNTSYLQYTYVGSGVTTRTWTVAMPTTAGSYEFRLFLNNGYTRAATSPTVVVVLP